MCVLCLAAVGGQGLWVLDAHRCGALLRDQWKNVSQVMVVYDVSNRESFTSCAKWLKAVRDLRPTRPIQGAARGGAGWSVCADGSRRRAGWAPAAGVLVANKIDMKDAGRAVVESSEGQAFAKEMGLTFFETSAVRALRDLVRG